MNRQSFVLSTAAVCGLVLYATVAEAQQARRYYYTTPQVTYRPATQPAVKPVAAKPVTYVAPAAVKPTVPASAPATTATASAVTAATTNQPATTRPAATQAQPQVRTFPPTILNMLTRNNAIRTSRGMRGVALSSRLSAAAQNHANYMASTGSFSHYVNGGPQGRAATYGFRGGVRENIAMGQPSVENAFAVWTASGGHYANMMSHSDVAGFGYAVGTNGQPYWVALYAANDGGN